MTKQKKKGKTNPLGTIWEKTRWLRWAIGIILVVIGFFFWGNYIINSSDDDITIQDSNLTNSPIIQKSSNVSVTYTTPSDSDMVNLFFYKKTFSITRDNTYFGMKFNLYGMKVILPDGQEAFLEKNLFNKSYTIGICNEELTDCYIYHKFRIKDKLPEDRICAILYTRLGNEDIGTDIMSYAPKFQTDPDSCYKVIE